MHFRTAPFGLIFFLILGASVIAVVRESLTIKSCYDGDTCRTTSGEKIRLVCIDTPELRGKRAQPERANAAHDRPLRQNCRRAVFQRDEHAAGNGGQPPRQQDGTNRL